MTDFNCEDLNVFIEEICTKYSDRKCLWNDDHSYTYKEIFQKVCDVASLLKSKNIESGGKVAIIAANSPQWVVSYFAILRAECIAVPILPDFTENDIAHILEEADVKAVFVGEQNLPRVQSFVGDEQLILNINEFPETHTTSKAKVSSYPTLASIIYTSGTSGHSKGVMLSHDNFLANLNSARTLIKIQSSWRFLSVLPLSHAYEFLVGMLLPLSCGASVYYLNKRPTPTILQSRCAAVKPDVICMVPLLLEKIYKKKILPLINHGIVKNFISKIQPLQLLMYRVLGKKIAAFFGGNIKLFAIGGAALHSEAEFFLLKAHLPYLVGYGLTEAAPLIAGGPFEDRTITPGSVGKVVPKVKLRLDCVNERTGVGEIEVFGANIMLGYFNNETLTSKTITNDGWLRTGDLGYMDSKKNLVLAGRLKNVIVLSSGENIYPEEIEEKLLGYLEISEVLVLEIKNKVGAIIVPDYEFISTNNSLDIDTISRGGSKQVSDIIDAIRRSVNASQPPYAKIQTFNEHCDPLIKTATHKVKRYLYLSQEST